MASRVAFFHEHAGYSYPAGASLGARHDNALRLARAEETATRRGWFVSLRDDPEPMADDVGTLEAVEAGELVNLAVVLRDEDGRELASLWGVAVPTEDDPYLRVVGAELALDVLTSHAECHARTTCGGCGHAWCGVCDPAPSALCHWCNGRGKSTAELPPVYSAG